MTDAEYQTNLSDAGERKILEQRIAEAIAPYIKRFSENVDRVRDLIFLWQSLKDNSRYSSIGAVDDILRVSVVFTHATLEDFLRTLAAGLYPETDKQTLNQIPLVDPDSSYGRAEKFSLGNLAQFKGKTVDEVIKNSVLNYLERSNFNKVSDISGLLENLGLDVSKAKRSFPKLEELMQRRHLIVHRADRSEPIGSDEQRILEIQGTDVIGWLAAVQQLFADVLPGAATRQLEAQGHIKNESDAPTLVIPKLH